MNIIIVGAGKTGNALCEQLSYENHNVVIIDTDKKKVSAAIDKFDILGVTGNGINADVLSEAGIENTDLFIATANEDAFNLLSCVIAKRLGAKHTVARVRNPEYSDTLDFLKEQFGISLIINPEKEAAREIARILRFPGAISAEHFADNKAELVSFKVEKDSPLISKSLYELKQKSGSKVLICAVSRGREIIIPHGSFILNENDLAYVFGEPGTIERFFKENGIYKNKTKNVMFVGGGDTAYYAASSLIPSGFKIKIIEQDENRAELLSSLLDKAEIILGDGADQTLLKSEGIEKMDAVVTITDIDEENIVISAYANSMNVDRVLTKIDKTSLAKMFGVMGINTVISPIALTANKILRYARAISLSPDEGGIDKLYKIAGASVEIVEFRAASAFDFLNRPLKSLKLKKNLLVACISRGGKIIIPGGDDVIEEGDKVMVAAKDIILNTLDDIIDI